jgi:hypothetical protein
MKFIKFEKLIRWKRNSSGTLYLQVLQLLPNSDKASWVSYTQATHKRQDYQMPGVATSKGFATAQKYLSLGYKYVNFEENYND